jgi:uncharacterized membrane protein
VSSARRAGVAFVVATAAVAAAVPGAWATAAGAPPGRATFPSTWSVLDGIARPGQTSEVSAMNDSGLVAGIATNGDGDVFPFVFDTTTGAIDRLPFAGSPDDISEDGLVVGSSVFPGDDDSHAWVWDLETGAVTDLTTLDAIPDAYSWASAINDDHVVVGGAWEYADEHDARPFRLDLDTGELTWLTPPDSGNAWANDISADGTIVGQATFGDFSRAVMWDAETLEMTDLGALPGDTGSWAKGIDDAGTTIVGASNVDSLELPTAIVVDVDTLAMSTLAGVDRSYAEDVNDAGVVVGSYEAPDGFGHGFLYDTATGDFDDAEGKGRSVLLSTSALTAVNDAGVAAGMVSEIATDPFASGQAAVLGSWAFSDVPPWHPFHIDVEWAAGEGIVDGYADGTYRPGRSTTRQSNAAFLHRLAGSPPVTPPSWRTFSDVPPGHVFFDEIEWMVAEGLTNPDGYPDGGFHPTAPATRQALAVFLYRRDGYPPFTPPAVPTFDDVSAGHPFFEEIEWMAAEGLTDGYADGGFHPGAPVSRQAAAALLHRVALGSGGSP